MKIRKALPKKALLIFSLIIIGYSLTSPPRSSKTGASQPDIITTIRVSPGNTTAYVNDTISLGVTIENVSDMLGYEFQLFWNRSILQCAQWNYVSNTWIQDPSTPPFDQVLVFQNKITDMPDGTSRYWSAVATTEVSNAVTGSVTVATLSFSVINQGETPLNLDGTLLSDKSGSPIEHDSVDGYLRATVIPEFSSCAVVLAVLATTLIVVLFCRRRVGHVEN